MPFTGILVSVKSVRGTRAKNIFLYTLHSPFFSNVISGPPTIYSITNKVLLLEGSSITSCSFTTFGCFLSFVIVTISIFVFSYNTSSVSKSGLRSFRNNYNLYFSDFLSTNFIAFRELSSRLRHSFTLPYEPYPTLSTIIY